MVPEKEARGVTAPARRQGKTPVRQWTLGVAGFGAIAIASGCRFDRPACNTLMAAAKSTCVQFASPSLRHQSQVRGFQIPRPTHRITPSMPDRLLVKGPLP